MTLKEKIEYLEENLTKLKSQRELDAVFSMGRQFMANKVLSEAQEEYLDIMIEQVNRVR